MQRGQLGDWTLETAPSGKGIIKAHSTLSNNFLHTLNKHDSWDITKPKLVLDHSYTINRLNSYIIEASTHGICCFTDGSKTEHGTGGGFVISDTRTKTITEHSFKMKDYCTVFQAETAAIKHAAEELRGRLQMTSGKWGGGWFLKFRTFPDGGRGVVCESSDVRKFLKKSKFQNFSELFKVKTRNYNRSRFQYESIHI